VIDVTANTPLLLYSRMKRADSPSLRTKERFMTGKLTKNASREPATLSDSDIVSNTKSTGASICSNGVRDADLTVVTGGSKVSGGGFPIGVIYRPGPDIKTR
jgi:hypothetical protein